MKTTNLKYVLMTPARNEEANIERTIKAVLGQSIKPIKWIIVSDGSTDDTNKIVGRYADKEDFIELITLEKKENRNFGAKAQALKIAYDILKSVSYDFIGNLDADISFDENYFENIINEFSNDPNLGLAGGLIYELNGGKFLPQTMSLNSVAGAVQLFRKESYDQTGGYLPLSLGGIDAVAEVMIRMNGWEVRTIASQKVYHHRRVGNQANNIYLSRFREGKRFYLIGYHPLFFLTRTIFRVIDRPFIIGSFIQLFGFFQFWISRKKREVSPEFVSYLHKEQIQRIGNLFKPKSKSIKTTSALKN